MSTFELTARAGRRVRSRKPARVLSAFETAPAHFFYLPVAIWWALLSLRYGSFTLPALANTTIRAGGLCGELKSEVLGILGPRGKARTAPWFLATPAPGMPPAAFRAELLDGMARAGIAFPVVAKPDVGRNGRGVRKIADIDALMAYFADYKDPVGVIVQEYSPWAGEAGIFFVRYPHEARGRIASVTLKYFPTMIGDGRSTLRALIAADPRAGRVPEFYLRRFAGRLDEVLPAGAELPLVFTGNHCQGAVFRDGIRHVTSAMTATFEAIARETPGFYFGRFDLRYRDLDALKRGEDFTLIEMNGAGAEATHIWDARMRLIDAYRTLFRQVRTAFEIGAEVRRRERRRPIGPVALLRLYFGELRAMRGYPAT